MRKLRQQELRRSSKRCELSLKLEWSAPARTRAKRNFRNFSKKKTTHRTNKNTTSNSCVSERSSADSGRWRKKKLNCRLSGSDTSYGNGKNFKSSRSSLMRAGLLLIRHSDFSLSLSPSSILSIIDYSELKSFMWSEMKWSNGIIVIVHIEVPRLRREVEAIEECWKITK